MSNKINVYVGNATLKKLKDMATKDELSLSETVKHILINHIKESEEKKK
jgi:hypothetical protein